MLCKKPHILGGVAFGCGQCLPCRVKRQRQWAHRIELEAIKSRDNSFVTLTYDDDHLPTVEMKDGRIAGNLVPKDLQDWLKRLRSVLSPLRLRFFAVGEYGSRSYRPHYHAILFGFPSCSNVQTRVDHTNGRADAIRCCSSCRVIQRTWPHGLIQLGQVNAQSTAYIARYTVKKLTGNMEALYNGRTPEFARMSLKNGGIGAPAVSDVARALIVSGRDSDIDVPHTLRHGAQLKPLDRYIRRKLRASLGREERAPDEALQKLGEEMLPLRVAARSSTKSLRKFIQERDEQAIATLEAKLNIYKSKDSI